MATSQPKPSRHLLAILIFLIYFCPVFILIYTYVQSLEFLSLGLLLAAAGSVLIFTLLRSWQSSLEIVEEPSKPAEPVLEAPPVLQEVVHAAPTIELSKHQKLIDELEDKKDEILKVTRERNQLQQLVERLEREKANVEQRVDATLQENDSQHKEYLKTISDQRDIIEQQEGHIANLENQVRDLKYEIKTLIELGPNVETAPELKEKGKINFESQIPAPLFSSKPDRKVDAPQPIEADLQLKRCLDIAQKITGTSLFGGESSRFRDLSMNSYSIDLRQLLDSLRSENSNTILLYSHKEERLLFANDQAKGLLGWSPEKFVQEFPNLIQEGMNEWKMALSNISAKGEAKVKLTLKSKSGQNVPVSCHLGMIPTGVFRHDVIGVIY